MFSTDQIQDMESGKPVSEEFRLFEFNSTQISQGQARSGHYRVVQTTDCRKTCHPSIFREHFVALKKFRLIWSLVGDRKLRFRIL